MTSDRLLTRPSLTPKMTARRVPDRPPARCHGSRSATSAALDARRATPTPSRPPTSRHDRDPRSPGVTAAGSIGASVGRPSVESVPSFFLSLSQIRACSRSSAAIEATSGDAPCASYASSSSPSSALTSSDTADVPSTRAARMMNRTRMRGASGGGTSRRARVSLRAQMSAWRRSLPAIRRKASARRGSFSMPASASYRTIASRSSLRLSRLCSTSMGGTDAS